MTHRLIVDFLVICVFAPVFAYALYKVSGWISTFISWVLYP